MTVGTGAQVEIGTDVAPVYSAWVESRRNVFDDPRVNTGTSTYWSGNTGPMTKVSGATLGETFAARFTLTTTGAQRYGALVQLVAGNTYTIRFKVRANVSRSGWSINYRHTAAGTSVPQIANLLTFDGTTRTFEYTFTVGAGTPTATTGIWLTNTAGTAADWIEVSGMEIEAGDHTGQGFIGAPRTAATDQVRFVGTPDASDSVWETRVLISSGSSSRWNVADYSVVEDSTPLDPSDTTGGFGQINVTLPEGSDTRGYMNKQLTLTDGALGETTGTVRQLQGNGLSAGITANSRIAQLAVERSIQPFVGTLSACITYHLGLCGITSGIVIDSSFSSINVQVPGGRENVYDRMRNLGAAYGFEMSLVSNNIVFRLPRQRVAMNYRNASVDWAMDQSNLARSIIGWWYNTTSGTSIAYPVQGDAVAADVYQVDAGETKVYEVPIDASLSSITQPVCVASVAINDMSASVYTVSSMATTEGVAMNPAVWTASGGSVTATISDDTKRLVITVRGADLPEQGPFRIAMPYGNNDFYSSLRILGTGVFWRKQSMTWIIGENQDLAPDEVGIEVDSPFMETFDQMYHRMLLTAARFSNDTQTIKVSSGGINRLGESGSARYATIGDVAAAYPGATIGSIFAPMGPTIGDWNAKALAMVSGDFANQAYGNVNGARVVYNHSYYRIRSATIGPREVTFTAERDNTIGDAYYYGETIGQWNARMAGKTIRDVNIAPLIEETTL